MDDTGTTVTTSQHHKDERYEALKKFVESAFKNHNVLIESLVGDASFRRYHRVHLGDPIDATIKPQKYDPSYIVMDAPPELESIESFVRMNLLLEMRVNVPTLLVKDIQQGFLLMQDFGSVEFAELLDEAKVARDGLKIDNLYRWAMDTLIKLQSIKPDLAQQAFHVENYDEPMLRREMDLFSDWFLPYVGLPLDKRASEKSSILWQDFKRMIVVKMLSQTQVVVHRDYHSRNLMQDQYRPESLGVIDFQDAVIGPYTYDLVSLVRDAYVDWNEVKVGRWIQYFWQHQVKTNMNKPITLQAFTAEVNITGIQRNLKVLGIFVRLAKRDGKARYLQYLPKVWRDLLTQLEWLNDNADTQTVALTRPMYAWLKDDIEPVFKNVCKDVFEKDSQ